MRVNVASTRAQWQALGTSVELLLSDPSALTRGRALVEDQLDAIDRACSRFRADSDLMRVNARPGRFVPVSRLLIEAVQVALRAAELTGGDVDPTVGKALELAGYDRDWRLLEQAGGDRVAGTANLRASTPRVRATLRSGWHGVELDLDRNTIRIPRGVKLDLGATAKAWAADRASRAVYEATGCGVLVSLGGDIATAGPPPTTAGWQIKVSEDHRDGHEAAGQTIAITGGGLATSSTTVRRWRHDGHTMHHIIDPATGLPTRGVWRTASVAAIDCTDANIAATATLVRGGDASAWLTELGLPARLVDNDGGVLRLGGWPEPTAATTRDGSARRPRVRVEHAPRPADGPRTHSPSAA